MNWKWLNNRWTRGRENRFFFVHRLLLPCADNISTLLINLISISDHCPSIRIESNEKQKIRKLLWTITIMNWVDREIEIGTKSYRHNHCPYKKNYLLRKAFRKSSFCCFHYLLRRKMAKKPKQINHGFIALNEHVCIFKECVLCVAKMFGGFRLIRFIEFIWLCIIRKFLCNRPISNKRTIFFFVFHFIFETRYLFFSCHAHAVC